ncbi:hypothetical protein PROFUN_04221 [Planoprotostelium fungivorum]|uniref:Uncharacterized protein n=1 Tax=Planoprotostelium fungivorum TaxID=1890364 RepID=A0A2P6NW00_9EUKA|nr:hypothetical protein PROFUN_04221 [Planoprotostelium fungivorum]
MSYSTPMSSAPLPTSPIRGGHYSHPPHHIRGIQRPTMQSLQTEERSNANIMSKGQIPKSWREQAKTENNGNTNREFSRELRQHQPALSPILDQTQNGTKKEIIMFVSQNEQYSICYPNWWAKVEPQPGQVLFVSPRSSPDEFCQNISVVVETIQENSAYNNFSNYTNSIIQSISDDPQIALLDSRPTTLSGIQSHQVVYSARHNNTALIFRQIWLLHKGKSYIVTFTCDANRTTSAVVNMAQEIMATLRLLSCPIIPSFSFAEW